MTLTVGGSFNTNTAIVSGPAPPPPELIRVCRSCAIPGISVRGWVGAFYLQTVRARVWLDRSKLFETLTVFLIFFSYTLSRNKGAKRLSVRRLVWAFDIRIYQRRVSRDKVYTIFKNSKLNFKVYTRYAYSVYVEGCIVIIFPFVRSSFLMFVIIGC